MFYVTRSSRMMSRIIWWSCAALIVTQLFGIHAHRTDTPKIHGYSHSNLHFAHSGLDALDPPDLWDHLNWHGDSDADGLKSVVMKTPGLFAIVLPMLWLLSALISKPLQITLQTRRIVDRRPRYLIKPPTQASPLR
jgi:hypothetical protein